MSIMKSMRLFFLATALLVVSTGIVRAIETNAFLVFEVDRYIYAASDGRASGPRIQQRFKVPLTEEFMSQFKNGPSRNSSGTGFCCQGGSLKTDQGSTGFTWWIRKAADNRWHINIWSQGVETIKGVRQNSPRPATSQNMTIKRWEDLEMSYMLSYPGLNISFTAKYVAAGDIEADVTIPAAPVRKADRAVLFEGDDLSLFPLEISCLFQE